VFASRPQAIINSNSVFLDYMKTGAVPIVTRKSGNHRQTSRKLTAGELEVAWDGANCGEQLLGIRAWIAARDGFPVTVGRRSRNIETASNDPVDAPPKPEGESIWLGDDQHCGQATERCPLDFRLFFRDAIPAVRRGYSVRIKRCR
jgi:hypothetical protein